MWVIMLIVVLLVTWLYGWLCLWLVCDYAVVVWFNRPRPAPIKLALVSGKPEVSAI